ncbi:hypothetical protein HN51_043496 [Arachis hypogaea]
MDRLQQPLIEIDIDTYGEYSPFSSSLNSLTETVSNWWNPIIEWGGHKNKSKPLELLASKEEEFYQLARRKEYFKHLKEDYFKPTRVPINRATRFENKVGSLDLVASESLIKKRILERFFIDLVALLVW